MKNFILQTWLLDNLNNEDLIILDARADLNDASYGISEYTKGHIEGARFVSMEETMTGQQGAHGGRHPLPEMEAFIEAMKKVGIEDNTTIVIYDDGSLEMAARLWWLLKYSGRDKVYVLAGGIRKWLLTNQKITTELPEIKESKQLSLNINHAMKVEMREVRSAIDSDQIVLVDSRAYERYTGAVEPLDTIAGHIPSAQNYPWMDLVADGEIMSKDELTNHYEGLQGYNELIVYCGSGITATVNYMFMEEIGLEPKLYAGSYSDWISYKNNQVVNSQFENLSGKEIWQKLYNKELNCKKNILEYIELTNVLKKNHAGQDAITNTYNYIYENIEGLGDAVKPNTIMFLKNTLKTHLGKYVTEKDPNVTNYFIEFFKEAYPKDKRRKDFTWVLMDINNITEEQVWVTLTYINKEVINNDLRLIAEHKRDIIDAIGIVIKKGNIKFINNIRSLSPLTGILKLKIVKVGNTYKASGHFKVRV